MEKIDLNGKWQFKAVDASRTLPRSMQNVTDWMEGLVPGTVHTDLLANDRIPDPFYRLNENEVQWIHSQRWVYRRMFVVRDDFLRLDAVHLVAEGLDTYAEVRLNGKKVGRTANMFIKHRFDVKSLLRSGENTIEIVFDSPLARSKSLEKKWGDLKAARESHRLYVRKAQYSFGWDWGPELTTSGIWRSIYLEASTYARLLDPFIKVVSVKDREAEVDCSVAVERYRKAPIVLRVQVLGDGVAQTHERRVVRDVMRLKVRIPQPQLWLPNGYGGQPIYSAIFTLVCEGEVVHTLEVPFAIRTIRLLQEKDEEGRSFILEVNRQKIFCKGANWIPSDSFLPRVSSSTYESLLQMAKDAHMNMVRVWGGGIYEQDVFYDLCDRLGLMVWQDFMFACGEYPEESWFLEQVREEADTVVKRLRNHPSVVLWCGNNECEWLFCTWSPGKCPEDMSGEVIFRNILPSICKQHDGTRPYWRSSPFGSGFPNAESNGNHHQWAVWSSWKDFKEYEKDHGRFITEFGFQSPAGRRTLEEITVPSDRHPQSTVIEHHNKQVEGPERLFRYQAAHYHISNSFDDFVYKGQLVQAEALKCAVEHWRRRKFKTAGALFWQLNDCWPVTSWSVIDSALRPKAAYYYARKFFAPVLVSFRKAGGNLEIWVTNDLTERISGLLTVSLRSFEGKKIWDRSFDIVLAPNSSKRTQRVAKSDCAPSDPTTHYLHAQFLSNGRRLSENRWYFVEPKHLRLPESNVTASVQDARAGIAMVVVCSERFAKNVRLEIEGEDVLVDDNYFDIDAGESIEVSLTSSRPAAELQRSIRLRCLNQEER